MMILMLTILTKNNVNDFNSNDDFNVNDLNVQVDVCELLVLVPDVLPKVFTFSFIYIYFISSFIISR